jgi:hypothetical protein
MVKSQDIKDETPNAESPVSKEQDKFQVKAILPQEVQISPRLFEFSSEMISTRKTLFMRSRIPEEEPGIPSSSVWPPHYALQIQMNNLCPLVEILLWTSGGN